MNILCIGTFSAVVTVTLKTGEDIYESRRAVGLQHNRTLMNLIHSVLKDAGIAPSDLTVIGCTQGPGSFTALRIVMSTAKGLAAGTEAFFTAVPTFDVVGRMFGFFPGAVVPLLDAKRGRVYAAVYRQGVKLQEETDIPPHLLLDRLPDTGPVLFAGDDPRPLLGTGVGTAEYSYTAADHLPFGPYLIDLAENMYKDNTTSEKEASPLYVRLSDAEMQRRNEHRP